MPAQSKAQQRFMGMVHAVQKGDMEAPSKEVEKAADSMSDKDAKDFASTKHKGLPDKVKEYVVKEARGVKSIQNDYFKTVEAIEQTLELYKKSKGTSNEKKFVERLKQLNTLKKKFSQELDSKVSGLYKDAELKVDEMTGSDAAGDYATPYAFGKKGNEKAKGKKQASLTGYTVVNEESDTTPNLKLTDLAPNKSVAATSEKKKDKEMADVSDAELVSENRWLELKRETLSPHAKIGKGIANINKQLSEMERFLNWYGKIKNENGVSNQNYWKRTNKHIYSIKERLIKLDQQIRKISE